MVLTLYKSRKLVVQGAGSWKWRNTVFREISRKLKPCNVENTQINPGHTPTRLRSESAKAENRNSSPIHKFVDTLINKITSPRAASAPVNHNMGETQNTPNRSTTRSKKTSKKTTAHSSSIMNDTEIGLATEDDTCVKQLYTKDDHNKALGSSEATSQITSLKLELEKQKKETNNSKKIPETFCHKLRH